MQTQDAASAVCPRCEGRGWVVEEDGGAGSARPCDCRQSEVVPRLLVAAAIPPRYAECRLATFQTAGGGDQLLGARRAAEQYVDAFLGENGRFRAEGLLFIGPPGVGKTHLAVAVLRELIERYAVRGLFVDFTSLIHQIQSTFDPASRESKHQVLDPVMGVDVLVLDELGAQKPTAWVNETLYLILNTRYTRRLTTIFTTNYSLASTASGNLDQTPAKDDVERLSHRIPASLVSRLHEMARPVEIAAADFRHEIRRHNIGQRLR